MDILYYLFFEMEGRGIFCWIATVALAVLIGSKHKTTFPKENRQLKEQVFIYYY